MIEFISQLPTEYQEVEYIQSSGTQYIDTGVVATSGFEVDIKINIDTVTGSWAPILSAHELSAPYKRNFIAYTSSKKMEIDAGDKITQTSITLTGDDVIKASNVENNFYLNVNGTNYTPTVTTAASNLAYSGRSIHLLHSNGYDFGYTSGKVYYCKITVDGTLVRNFVPCYRKSDNIVGLYDLINGAFYTNAGTGNFAKGKNSNSHSDAVITPGGVIPMQYALRRRMMNRILQLFYYGLAPELSVGRERLAATTVGNYALFGGGYRAGYLSTVDAYDTSLTRTTPTALSKARYYLAATTVGNYALFGGGIDGSAYVSTVDAYDTSLTRTTPTALSEARGYLVATTVGNYALFGGGYGSGYLSTVDAYDTSLTRITPTVLSVARYMPAATAVGNYALFGGGMDGSAYVSTVDAYDTSLIRTTPIVLSAARNYLAATTVGNYALFGGGYNGTDRLSTVDAYDTSLTRTTPTALSVIRAPFATTVGNYALFGGGYNGTDRLPTVDAYDTSLTRTTPTAFSVARDGLSVTTVGNYALFGGGHDGTNLLSTVDVYQVK